MLLVHPAYLAVIRLKWELNIATLYLKTLIYALRLGRAAGHYLSTLSHYLGHRDLMSELKSKETSVWCRVAFTKKERLQKRQFGATLFNGFINGCCCNWMWVPTQEMQSCNLHNLCMLSSRTKPEGCT